MTRRISEDRDVRVIARGVYRASRNAGHDRATARAEAEDWVERVESIRRIVRYADDRWYVERSREDTSVPLYWNNTLGWQPSVLDAEISNNTTFEDPPHGGEWVLSELFDHLRNDPGRGIR